MRNAVLALCLLGATAYAQDPQGEKPLGPRAQRASQLLAAGDRVAACQEARAAAQEDPDPRITGIIRLSCDKGDGAFVFKSTSTGKRYDIISGQPAQGGPAENLRPNQPRPGPQPGQPGMPAAGEPDLEHGKVAVPATPLATIVQQPTSYDKTISAQDDLNHGHFEEAAAGAEAAIALDPKNQRAYQLLAVARHSAGDYGKALEAAERGLALNPLNQTLLRAKTAATLKQGDYQKAVENADALLKTYATDGLTLVFKAYAIGKLGDRDAMLNTLKTAAALDPAYERVLIEAQNSDPNGEPFAIPGDAKPKPKAAVILRKEDPNRKLKVALFLAGVFVFVMICGLLLYSIAAYRARQDAEAQAAEAPAEEAPANSPGPQS